MVSLRFCSSSSPVRIMSNRRGLTRGIRNSWRPAFCIALVSFVSVGAWGQVLSHRPAEPARTVPAAPASGLAAAPMEIPLTVQAGTPIEVALDREVRVRQVGQPIHGKVAEPVYAFDKLLIPAGAEVLGKITSIGSLSKKQRTFSALNADFSPPRQVSVSFNELVLPEGRHVPIQTSVTPAPDGVLRFVTAKTSTNGKNDPKATAGNGRVSKEVAAGRAELKNKWTSMKKLVTAPGKMHRLERFALAKSPYRPQYLEPGTVFDANLEQPLSFGAERLWPQELATVGTEPPPGSVVHARLVTPLSSRAAKRGDPVEAVITRPVVTHNQLFFPEGSHLKGTVLEARPARWLSHNGQLRITFHQIVPPSGMPQEVQSTLQGVSVAGGERLALDSEGGARVTNPGSRYFTTALSMVLATSTALDRDAGHRTPSASGADMGKGAATGAFGFRLVGTVVGAVSKSRAVNSSLGFYGAGLTLYSHFLARGRDVVYPRDMSMLIELGSGHGRQK